jgi:hypothetical protein
MDGIEENHAIGLTTAKTWKTTLITKQITKGTIRASRVESTFFDLFEEAVINSLLDKSRTRTIATIAPPMPKLIAVVIATALVADVVSAATSKSCPYQQVGNLGIKLFWGYYEKRMCFIKHIL